VDANLEKMLYKVKMLVNTPLNYYIFIEKNEKFMEKQLLKLILYFAVALQIIGCSGTKQVQEVQRKQNRDLALEHFIRGSTLDQKGEYATAILEYQDALKNYDDPAIYNAIAKDYSILGKHDLAMQMGREAVKLEPNNRVYRQTLAEIYINAFALDDALKEYEAITVLDPKYQDAWLYLAKLQSLRNPEKALETYQKIISQFGPVGDVYYQMAQIYSALGKYKQAAEALQGMLELDPGNFEITKELGDIYLQQDSVEKALKVYTELTELHPENLSLRAAIAHAYLTKQNYDAAAEQFETVMQKDTLTIEEQIKFGQIFVSFIEKDSAVAPYAVNLFEKIKTNYPDDWRPYWFLGAINNIQHKDSIAIYNYEKVIELAKSNPDGWVGAASIHYDRGQFDKAINLLLEAKKFVPDEFRIYFLLGVSYQRLHQTIEAASALEKAIQLNEKSVDALSALGLVYDEMKRFEDSDSIYEKALRLDPANHLLLNNYGYSLAERGIQLERALKMSKEAITQQPENQSYLDTYGWIYYKLGDYKEAEKWIQKAIELGSKSAVIYEHMGDIYLKLNEKDKAIDYWKKALELDPNNKTLQEKILRGGS
jgi:tetratricopeptide (TPR) repeat protein